MWLPSVRTGSTVGRVHIVVLIRLEQVGDTGEVSEQRGLSRPKAGLVGAPFRASPEIINKVSRRLPSDDRSRRE